MGLVQYYVNRILATVEKGKVCEKVERKRGRKAREWEDGFVFA